MKVDPFVQTAALQQIAKRRIFVTFERSMALILVCSIAAAIAMTDPLLSLLCGIFVAMTTVTFVLAQRLGTEIAEARLVVKK